jgi:alkylation response protein AidB-like acyl-CoA dehydrogenase
MNTSHHLSDDERMLSEAAYAFVAGVTRSASGQEFDSGRDWTELVNLGWIGVLTPADEGGFGGSYVDLLLLSQALGFGLVRSPFLSSVALTTPLLAIARPNQRARWLPDVLAGKQRLALAHQESNLDPAGEDLLTRAFPQGEGYRLDGTKRMVLYGADANMLIVSAMIDTQNDSPIVGTFLVEPTAPGVTTIPYRLIDGSEAANFTFDGVIIDGAARLGDDETDVADTLEEAVFLATLAAIGCSVGCMEVALELTVEHLKTRRQFGEPLASFQALRHRVADMYIALEELRSLSFAAARTIDGPTRRAATRAAKIHLGHAGIWAVEQAVQLHGAIGITDECKVGQALKMVTVLDRLFGGADHHIAQMSADLMHLHAE